MLLTVDIGNTTIFLGIFSNNILLKHKKISTKKYLFYKHFKSFFDLWIKNNKISSIIISSVVPKKTFLIRKIVKKYFKIKPITLKSTMIKNLPMKYNLNEIGIDRLVNIIAAKKKYGQPLIIIDAGTATTIDVLSKKGEFIGGVILPGIDMLKGALHKKTAKLPLVSLNEPKKLIATNTKEAIQSGLIYGYRHFVSGLVQQIIKELKYIPKIIITGGQNKWLKTICLKSIISETLTLEGLNIIAHTFVKL